MADSEALPCLRCGGGMMPAGTHKVHEGECFGGVTGLAPLPPTLLPLELFFCPECGHAEFFVPEVRAASGVAAGELPALRPGEVLGREATVAREDGMMEQTWMCSCGEVNFASYDKCLGCGAPRPDRGQQ